MRAVLRILCSLAVLVSAVAPTSAGTIEGSAGCGARCSDFVIYVEGAGGRYSGGGEVVNFDQKDKAFVPHVLPILQGTTVKIGNGDPFLHNVHAYLGKDTFFNVALPFQGQTVDQVFAEAGNYLILCDAHPEMSAFIVALENPFFAQPGEDGTFRIPDVPAGSHTLVRYDAEKEKSTKKQVTVGDGSVAVSF